MDILTDSWDTWIRAGRWNETTIFGQEVMIIGCKIGIRLLHRSCSRVGINLQNQIHEAQKPHKFYSCVETLPKVIRDCFHAENREER